MTYGEILSRLDALESRLVKGVKDNMRIEQIHLKIFPDGSGLVDADWSKCTEDMCKEERLLHTIFSIESPLYEFPNVEELSKWLKDMTPEVPDSSNTDGVPKEIMELAESEDSEGALDDLVHDVASNIGSAVNNGGTMEQIRFLRENGIEWAAIREYLTA